MISRKAILLVLLITFGVPKTYPVHATQDAQLGKVKLFSEISMRISNEFIEPKSHTEMADLAIIGMANHVGLDRDWLKDRKLLSSGRYPKVVDNSLPLDDMKRYLTALTSIQSTAPEVSADKLTEAGISHLLESLDEQNAYLSPEQYKEITVGTKADLRGALGLQYQSRDKKIVIVDVFPDTPASRAGIRSGDEVLAIDGKSVEDLPSYNLTRFFNGKIGSKTRLKLKRGDGELEIFAVREKINVYPVEGNVDANGVARIRIRNFNYNVPQHLQETMKRLQKRYPNGIRGMVLDLRSNSGGLLSHSVAVADYFLKSGLVMYTKGRSANSNLHYEATVHLSRPDFPDLPVAVLINKATAGSAEIVAAALQDHGRAVVIGQRSFGLGKIQTLFPVSNGGGLKLTTAHYYRPSGMTFAGNGVLPNICLVGEGSGPLSDTDQEDKCTETISLESGNKDTAIEFAAGLLLDGKRYRGYLPRSDLVQ